MTTPDTEPDRSRIHAAYEAVAERVTTLGDPATAETVRRLHRAYTAEVAYFTEVRAALMPGAVAGLVTAGGSPAAHR